MSSRVRRGLAWVEILIVVVIMAVLVATIIPQCAETTTEAKKNTSVFNLQSMRSQIETFRAQHHGKVPSTLALLTTKSNRAGSEDSNGPYGPYIPAVPEETITGSNTVTVISGSRDPIAASDVTADGGWLYNSTTGEIRINDASQIAL